MSEDDKQIEELKTDSRILCLTCFAASAEPWDECPNCYTEMWS